MIVQLILSSWKNAVKHGEKSLHNFSFLKTLIVKIFAKHYLDCDTACRKSPTKACLTESELQ